MAQQAQNDHYADDRALALAYADVVREEIADLFAAGADIVQLDEPWLQARPDVARRYGAEALTRAVEGAAGPVHVHLCFGYAAMVAERPDGYSFLPELADTPVDSGLGRDGAVAPRSRRRCGRSRARASRSASSTSRRRRSRRRETIADRVRRALDSVDVDKLMLSSDCGLKYLPRASAAGKMRSLAEAAALLRAEL